MYINADVTLYLYTKDGRDEKYTRTPIDGVYWEDVRHSTFIKTGQRDACSVMLVIPLDNLGSHMTFTQGKDLVVKGIIAYEIDCSSQEDMSKSLAILKSDYGFVTVTTVDERLYGSRSSQHYELSCR